MTSPTGNGAKAQPPRLHHIDTSNGGGVSGPFWDSSGRCFWLMNDRQVYTHPEGGSSACATIASANPDSAYPSGWSSGQRTRSLSGSDATPESVAHEHKRIRPEYFPSASYSKLSSEQQLRNKYLQPGLSNIPPSVPSPPQRSQSVRFSPNPVSFTHGSPSQRPLSYQPNPSDRPSFPQRSQSVRFDTRPRTERSGGPSPSPKVYGSSLPTPQNASSFRSNTTSTSTTYTTPSSSSHPQETQYLSRDREYYPRSRESYQPPPSHSHDREHEDEDYSPSIYHSQSHHSPTNASTATPSHSNRQSRNQSRRENRHRRDRSYDYDVDSDNMSDTNRDYSGRKEKRLVKKGDLEQKKKHEKALKGLGEVGRGEMGRASFLAALPFVCFLARLAA